MSYSLPKYYFQDIHPDVMDSQLSRKSDST
jgi:hypothetical protein